MNECNLSNMKNILDELEQDIIHWIKHHYWYYYGAGKNLPKEEKLYDNSIIVSEFKTLNIRVEKLLPFEEQLCLKNYKSLIFLFTYKKILNTEFNSSSATEMSYRLEVISLFYYALVNINTD